MATHDAGAGRGPAENVLPRSLAGTGRLSVRHGLLHVAALACLGLAAPASAGTTWVGAQLHFPVPARDIGNTQLGVDAGATFTHMYGEHFGVGVDFAYHYWPASAGYTAAFDRYLRSTRLEALEGSTWAFTALQYTGHVKLVAPEIRGCTPWAQVGAGTYRLNLNIDESRPNGTYAWFTTPFPAIAGVGGGYGSVGLDVHLARRVLLGVDGTFHHVWSRREAEAIFIWAPASDLPDFSAFTLGTHVMIGW